MMNAGLFRSILDLIKIKQTLLLVFTCVATYIIAANWEVNLVVITLLALSAFLVISGTTMVNMFYDRSIDAEMMRTNNRPLVTGRFPPFNVLGFGLLIFIIGLLIGVPLGPYFWGLEVVGFIVNIFVYTILLKRTHTSSFIFGSIAGGLPSMAGWFTYSQGFELTGILVGLIVITWIPTHILSLAIQYKDDFKKAKIPVLPNLLGDDLTFKLILISNVMLGLVLVTLYYLAGFGLIYLTWTLILSLILCIVLLEVYRKRTISTYKRLYKFAGVYLFLIFIVMLVDTGFNVLFSS